MKTLLTFLMLLGAAAGGYYYYATQMVVETTTSFRTTAITRGDLLSTISATGTVEPEEVVDVGAQVVGRIKSLGLDPKDPEQKKTIDYDSVVEEGTILAMIDDAVYRAQVNQAAAALQRANADLMQYQAKSLQMEQEWKRAQSLRPKGAIADTDYDLAAANYKAAKANVAVGEAAIKQGEASLELAKTNLDYTVIKSPVRGVIIDRRVNIGQTVVSSMNAPSLFLIAKDLRRIQVWASVNEADIGRIHVGLPVRFTVDTYPDDVFYGKVSQIRLNATMTQNVVTYTVVVVTDNLDGKLLPYLTANLQFEIEQHTDVLLVPNAALRWKPRPAQIDPAMQNTAQAESPAKGKEETNAKTAKPREHRGRLWIDFKGLARPIDVQVGPTDGTMTMISSDGVKEGMEVIIGEGRANDNDTAETTNPFGPPKIFGKREPKK
jgi:HlyD family secretion protein